MGSAWVARNERRGRVNDLENVRREIVCLLIPPLQVMGENTLGLGKEDDSGATDGVLGHPVAIVGQQAVPGPNGKPIPAIILQSLGKELHIPLPNPWPWFVPSKDMENAYFQRRAADSGIQVASRIPDGGQIKSRR